MTYIGIYNCGCVFRSKKLDSLEPFCPKHVFDRLVDITAVDMVVSGKSTINTRISIPTHPTEKEAVESPPEGEPDTKAAPLMPFNVWDRLDDVITSVMDEIEQYQRTRELSLAITKLQEAGMWLERSPNTEAELLGEIK